MYNAIILLVRAGSSVVLSWCIIITFFELPIVLTKYEVDWIVVVDKLVIKLVLMGFDSVCMIISDCTSLNQECDCMLRLTIGIKGCLSRNLIHDDRLPVIRYFSADNDVR